MTRLIDMVNNGHEPATPYAILDRHLGVEPGRWVSGARARYPRYAGSTAGTHVKLEDLSIEEHQYAFQEQLRSYDLANAGLVLIDLEGFTFDHDIRAANYYNAIADVMHQDHGAEWVGWDWPVLRTHSTQRNPRITPDDRYLEWTEKQWFCGATNYVTTHVYITGKNARFTPASVAGNVLGRNSAYADRLRLFAHDLGKQFALFVSPFQLKGTQHMDLDTWTEYLRTAMSMADAVIVWGHVGEEWTEERWAEYAQAVLNPGIERALTTIRTDAIGGAA